MYRPYPNPSYGKPVSINIEIIRGQKISTTIYNVLGQTVWSSTKVYSNSEVNNFVWDGINNRGKKVSSGLYIVKAVGKKKTLTDKFIFLKDQ